jgi:hypothetical protein
MTSTCVPVWPRSARRWRCRQAPIDRIHLLQQAAVSVPRSRGLADCRAARAIPSNARVSPHSPRRSPASDVSVPSFPYEPTTTRSTAASSARRNNRPRQRFNERFRAHLPVRKQRTHQWDEATRATKKPASNAMGVTCGLGSDWNQWRRRELNPPETRKPFIFLDFFARPKTLLAQLLAVVGTDRTRENIFPAAKASPNSAPRFG